MPIFKHHEICFAMETPTRRAVFEFFINLWLCCLHDFGVLEKICEKFEILGDFDGCKFW